MKNPSLAIDMDRIRGGRSYIGKGVKAKEKGEKSMISVPNVLAESWHAPRTYLPCKFDPFRPIVFVVSFPVGCLYCLK